LPPSSSFLLVILKFAREPPQALRNLVRRQEHQVIVLKQAQRRQKVEQQQADLRTRQDNERALLLTGQKGARAIGRNAYLADLRKIKAERRANWPKGLSAVLGRFSGIEMIRKAVHRYQDRQRYRAYKEKREKLLENQKRDRHEQQRRHEMQALELARKLRALTQIDRYELRSLEESLQAEQRISARGGKDRMPAVGITLKPRGRPAAPHKAINRHSPGLSEEMAKPGDRQEPQPIDLTHIFEKAARDGESGESGRGASEGPKRVTRSRSHRRRTRRRDRDRDR
jgi:hypothetical protein